MGECHARRRVRAVQVSVHAQAEFKRQTGLLDCPHRLILLVGGSPLSHPVCVAFLLVYVIYVKVWGKETTTAPPHVIKLIGQLRLF